MLGKNDEIPQPSPAPYGNHRFLLAFAIDGTVHPLPPGAPLPTADGGAESLLHGSARVASADGRSSQRAARAMVGGSASRWSSNGLRRNDGHEMNPYNFFDTARGLILNTNHLLPYIVIYSYIYIIIHFEKFTIVD